MWSTIAGLGWRSNPVRTGSVQGTMYLAPAGTDREGRERYWLIGRYKDQTKLATSLRNRPALVRRLAARGVIYGRRDTDKPPVHVPRQKAFGPMVPGRMRHKDFTLRRIGHAARKGDTAPPRRCTDAWSNVQSYWATQTPQSHHIVEFNHLRNMGVSRRRGRSALDHGQLPCVLLAAEFHQRLISARLKNTHDKQASWLWPRVAGIYGDLYADAMLRSLGRVAGIILAAAGASHPPAAPAAPHPAPAA